ncbi:MAG: response regulator [Planctomycetaceae bacterium]|nr:response regulator [Planctomycetaceae bacterium]
MISLSSSTTYDNSLPDLDLGIGGQWNRFSASPQVINLQSQIVRPIEPNSESLKKNSHLLIIDDEPINLRLIEKCLQQAGYTQISTHSNPSTAFATIAKIRPDLVLCDVIMSVSGLDILKQVAADEELRHIPMVMVTASDDELVRSHALELGAAELLTKPLRSTSLLPRVRNALLLKSRTDQIHGYSRLLEQQIQQRTAELMMSRLELIHCLARLAEFRDNETGHHVIRVGRYAGLLARRLNVAPELAELIEQAAPLHDIGKIGIPDEILLKPGKLTPEEFELMQKHVGLGKRVFQPLPYEDAQSLRNHTVLGELMVSIGSSPLLQMAAEIALTHHERWDGTGYPIGLKGEDIPISGRIVAVADVFDALSSKRPYKPALPLDRCFEILLECRGTHLDPAVVDAFLTARDEILQIRIKLADID